MKKFMLVLLSLSILIIGCNNENTLLNDSEIDGMLKSAKAKMVPIKGTVQSHVDVYNEGIPVQGTLSGMMSHLGELITENSVWNTTALDYDEATWTITWEMTGHACASNGDLLNYTLSGTFVIPDNKLSAQLDFNGGTGRFEFAKGYLNITGYADNPATITTMYMDGTGMISNVGQSNK